MPIWSLRSTDHLAVELDSDDGNVSSSSTGSSSEGSDGVFDRAASRTPRNRMPESKQHASAGKTLQEPTAPVTDLSLNSNRFTTGIPQRAIVAPVVYPFLFGSSPCAVSAHSNYQCVQHVQEKKERKEYASAASSAHGISARSSRAPSFAYSCEALEEFNTLNILVLGAQQVGKSHFINSYRAAITNTTRWPSAAVGISGCYGTTTVEPFPNRTLRPTWLCIDTPGCVYAAEHEILLEKLTEGMPWKTKLVGLNALTLSQIKDFPPIPANRAHQCVIVVPATDFIKDEGWINTLLWRNRYIPTDDVEAKISHLKSLVTSVRTLMNDAPPFVVVSKMDKFGGAGSTTACATLASILTECVPVNRLYFTAAVQQNGFSPAARNIILESSTKRNFVRLHEDICFATQWYHQMDAM